jgi:hypothetical protein
LWAKTPCPHQIAAFRKRLPRVVKGSRWAKCSSAKAVRFEEHRIQLGENPGTARMGKASTGNLIVEGTFREEDKYQDVDLDVGKMLFEDLKHSGSRSLPLAATRPSEPLPGPDDPIPSWDRDEAAATCPIIEADQPDD